MYNLLIILNFQLALSITTPLCDIYDWQHYHMCQEEFFSFKTIE